MEHTNQADQYRKLQELYADMSDSRLEAMADEIDDLTEIAQQVLRAEIARRGLDVEGNAPPVPLPQSGRQVTGAKVSPGAWSVMGQQSPVARPQSGRGEAFGQGLDEVAEVSPEDLEETDEAKLPPEIPGTDGRDPFTQGFDPKAYEPVGIWTVIEAAKARQIMEILTAAKIKCFLGPDNVEKVDDFKGDFSEGVEVKVMKFQARFALDGLRRTVPPEPEEEQQEPEELAIACPRCNSPDIVFLGLIVDPENRSKKAEKNSWTCDACGHQWEDDGIVMEE